MKKHLLVILSLLFSTMLFAQTKAVEASKLVSTLEKNKKTTIVFTSSVNLKGISVKSDGALTIPSLASEKIKFIAGIDTEALQERLNYKNLSSYNIELVLKDVATKTYEITKIAGIESVSQYKTLLPFTMVLTGESFILTPFSRIDCVGRMKVRPTYLLLIRPISYGSPLASA